MKFDIALYDHDGVVANSFEHVYAVEVELCRRLGIKIPSREMVRQSHDGDYDDYYLNVLGLDEGKYAQFDNNYRDVEKEVKEKLNEIKLIPGAFNHLNKSNEVFGKENINIISGSDSSEIKNFYERNNLTRKYNKIYSVWDSKAKYLFNLAKDKSAFFLTDSGKDVLSVIKARNMGLQNLVAIVMASEYSFSSIDVLEDLSKKHSSFIYLTKNYDEVNEIVFS